MISAMMILTTWFENTIKKILLEDALTSLDVYVPSTHYAFNGTV